MKKAALGRIGKAKQAHGETAPGKTLCSELDKALRHNTLRQLAGTSRATMYRIETIAKAGTANQVVKMTT